MFKRRPEIHGYRPYLEFHRNHNFPVYEEHRNFQSQMQAPVAVILRALDIVLAGHQFYIVLGGKHVRHLIYVFDEIADYPQARDVLDIFPCRGNGYFTSQPGQFLLYRFSGLKPLFDVMYR